jgi:hypothetical protein
MFEAHEIWVVSLERSGVSYRLTVALNKQRLLMGAIVMAMNHLNIGLRTQEIVTRMSSNVVLKV